MAFFHFRPPLNFNSEKLTLSGHNVIKLCTVNALFIVNTFVLHALHRKIKHAAIIMRKLKKNIYCGGKRKRAVKVKKTYVDSG